MKTDPSAPEITVPATATECTEELLELQAQANTAQTTIGQLQQQLLALNERAILLQGALAAYENTAGRENAAARTLRSAAP